MSTEETKAIARRFSQEILSKGDLSLADQLLDPNYVNHNPIPGQVPGIEGFKKSAMGLRAALPFEETIEDLIAEGDKVVVRVVRKATHSGAFMGIPASGKQVTVPATYILRIVNGKITDAWLNWDLLGLMQQLGAIPARTSG